ncbi:albusnodin/ikarugamycin family macrolactam cyclase [Kitasatospora sp. NPDC093550]|uniref:albusnodin/ikarugamycin family macrolactam cyclase n=1 Tax=Kitasatospora sp. NPDC093550 TaxID=3364089 RepID=UPI0037FFAA17
MRWFGGRVGCTGAEVPVPEGARRLWDGPFPLWLVGHWPSHEVKVYNHQRRNIAVLGPCEADRTQLAVLLDPRNTTPPVWPGSYTVVVADERGLIVYTDAAGACPIYTTQFENGTIWASSSRALAPLVGGNVDTQWLATSLVHPTRSPGGRSAFAGVEYVEAGSRLSLRPGHRPLTEPSWQPRSISSADAPGELRAALEGGVAVRVRNAHRPTTDLSGGMDSTSIGLLAARHLTGRQQLGTFTIHPEGQDGGSGDLHYARLAIDQHPMVEHTALPLGEDHLPYARLDEVPATDEPAPSTITFARLASQLEVLRGYGSDSHQTGDGGDSLLWQPNTLAEFARRRQLIQLVRHTQGLARLFQVSPWPLLREAISTKPTGLFAPLMADWITPRARELATAVQGSYPDWTDWSRSDSELLHEMRMVGRTARADAQVAETFGVTFHNPFTDAAVVTAVLSAPEAERGSAWSYKPLLAKALADVLPAEIAARNAKGAFDADHHQGLRAHLAAVSDLADGRLAELGLIEPGEVRKTLRKAVIGVRTPFGSLEPMLAMEVWLRALDRTAAVAWTVEWQAQEV